MPVKKATETDTEEGEKESKDGQTDQGDGGKSADTGSLDERIKDLVKQAVDALVGDHGKGGRVTAADDEERLSRLVQDAQVKLKADEDKESRFKKVEETLQQVVEKPPARDGLGGKISRFMWGSDK